MTDNHPEGSYEQWGNHKLGVSRAASSLGASGEGSSVVGNTDTAGFYRNAGYRMNLVLYGFITNAESVKFKEISKI